MTIYIAERVFRFAGCLTAAFAEKSSPFAARRRRPESRMDHFRPYNRGVVNGFQAESSHRSPRRRAGETA
ncbi:MAG TPA: hypothetical protein VMV10_17225 [Pirellulales bacterium]|nr:hypothetical protein [Pirellulales bacterium]